jgi:hypothetical protein
MPRVRPLVYVQTVLGLAAGAGLGFSFSPNAMGALIGLAMSVVYVGPIWAHALGLGPDASDPSEDTNR